ncbi:TPA: class I SAM-dependent methyltransferase [archaeon]|uniref:Class I SAM-dependent methyltransferase n=1 Tax=Candidatus Naiadarchaeum limnaeum TaxID=2756139 RepID=A0A832XID4_9ARCH|nr:class I SAM-dependent methyltransferase [Candidatus Naiadarchaeum limnaeum]
MSEQEDLQNFVEFCDSKFGQRIMKKEAKFLREQLQGHVSILDIGCGIGSIEKNLSEMDITGIDTSELFLEEAKKRNKMQRNKVFEQCNATNLEALFREKSFSAVFSVATVEFIENYQPVLTGIWRILKSNGKVILMILNPASKYFEEHLKKPDSYFRRVKHSPAEIKKYFAALFYTEDEFYFLGIKGKRIFNTSDKQFASLYVLIGRKR